MSQENRDSNSMTAFVGEELAMLRREYEASGPDNHVMRLLATIAARDAEIARLEAERDRLHKETQNEQCDHGVTFDEVAAHGLSASEVRKRWPRGFGPCPKGCGFDGIAYASYLHYLSGDW